MQQILLLTLIVLFLDVAWLTLMKDGYNHLVYKVQGKPLSVKYAYAIASYICVILTLVFFAMPLIRQKVSNDESTLSLLKWCFVYGGGIGFLTYGVFNFTNLAIFTNYSETHMAALDIAWGTFLYTIATFLCMKVVTSPRL